MNNCDNFAELFSCARLAYQAGDYDEEKGNPVRSTKKLAEKMMQGFGYRKGHLAFIRHAYRMGRFNREMQNLPAQD
jgi:hypothetical protein